jgi:hypothetical protein
MRKGSYTYFKLPGAVYGNKFPTPQPSEKEARKWIREHLDVKRLPQGIEIW